MRGTLYLQETDRDRGAVRRALGATIDNPLESVCAKRTLSSVSHSAFGYPDDDDEGEVVSATWDKGKSRSGV